MEEVSTFKRQQINSFQIGPWKHPFVLLFDIPNAETKKSSEEVPKKLFWGDNPKGSVNHLVKWNIASLCQEYGELGIGNLTSRNHC